MKRSIIALALLCALAVGCSGRHSILNSSPVQGDLSPEDNRRFTLIYFFGVSSFDPRRAVFLDFEDDEIQMAPNMRDFEYEKLQGVTLGEGLYEAEVFFASEPKIINSVAYTISTPEGAFAGYELLPLYDPKYLGKSELLDVFYTMGPDGVVLIDVEIKKGIPKPY